MPLTENVEIIIMGNIQYEDSIFTDYQLWR